MIDIYLNVLFILPLRSKQIPPSRFQNADADLFRAPLVSPQRQYTAKAHCLPLARWLRGSPNHERHKPVRANVPPQLLGLDLSHVLQR